MHTTYADVQTEGIEFLRMPGVYSASGWLMRIQRVEPAAGANVNAWIVEYPLRYTRNDLVAIGMRDRNDEEEKSRPKRKKEMQIK